MSSLSRRDFIRVSSLVAAGTVAAACVSPTPTAAPAGEVKTPQETAPAPQPQAQPEVSRYSEAPTLTDLVSKGELPPVDERLPESPDVLAPVESVGKYGGTWRRGFKGVSDRWGPTKLNSNNLATFNLDLTLRPAVVESWQTNEDASTWTWNLRKGTKWSDGVPLTSEHFAWYYQYQAQNTDLSPTIPTVLSTGTPKVLAELETPDEFTVTYKFAHPNPLLVYSVASHTLQPLYSPGHYMKRYHMELTDDPAALQAEIKEKGFDSWAAYFGDRNNWYLNPERPGTDPWVATNTLSEELFILQRNPYFWQVDPEGQQLPYIDRVHHRLFESTDTFNMWVLNGEVDCQGRHVDIGNYTLFKDGQEKGAYEVVLNVGPDHLCIQPNLTSKNQRLREFFQQRNVKIAMLLCFNRAEIIELAYNGMGKPRQYSPIEQSPNYYPKLSDAYLDFDPEEANRLLDEAGYTERDAVGYRLWKDHSGEPVSFIIEGTAAAGSTDEDAFQMEVKYLADVGIKSTYKYVERSLYEEHFQANEVDVGSWSGDYTVLPIVSPEYFLGTELDHPWAVAWALWRTNPEDPNAEEPPQDHWIRKIWDIWDQVRLEADEAKRNKLFEGILDIWAEELPMIGLVGQLPRAVIRKNGLRNYPGGYPSDDAVKDEHLQPAQHLYWEEPDKHV
ncbi:MAG: ABC transporter substrate-binding protein [Chloroflexi bacterium]|nr:ABC transporter substrate-binding protein [Chloroflexota bacterium]